MIQENIRKSLPSTEIPLALSWEYFALLMKSKWDLQIVEVFVFFFSSRKLYQDPSK